MEWPTLGRVAACKRSLQDEPRPAKKTRKAQYHWNMKLAMLFQKKGLPEIIEKAIADYAIPKQFTKFLELYGQQRARYWGLGFVSGWHPRVASTTKDRFIWRYLHRHGDLCEPLDRESAKSLKGRTVLIVYRNRLNRITKMNPKRVVDAAQDRMRIDDGPNTEGFNVYYQGIFSIDLFVDLPRASGP